MARQTPQDRLGDSLSIERYQPIASEKNKGLLARPGASDGLPSPSFLPHARVDLPRLENKSLIASRRSCCTVVSSSRAIARSCLETTASKWPAISFVFVRVLGSLVGVFAGGTGAAVFSRAAARVVFAFGIG